MPPDEQADRPDRQQTDQSLRAEREKSDDLDDPASRVDEAADTVLARARERADAVLTLARARVDRSAARAAHEAPVSPDRDRAAADRIVEEERAEADAAVRIDRQERAARLEREREATDQDLSREREQSDVAVATRDEFLGIVSHDLRNMLHVMVGFAALIENDTDPSKHVQYAQRIRRSGARMKRLLGDLLDIASIEAGKLAVVREAVDPAAVVAEAVEGFQTQAAERHIDLRQECVPGSSRASLDPARVLQVLVNLLSNSLKFTPAGGSVIVRLEPTDEQLLFSVEDSGVGIAPANLAAIFGRFHQLDEKDRRGVGLGLYISQCIVEGHGGHIWAESVLGKGSTFSFTIPADAGA